MLAAEQGFQGRAHLVVVGDEDLRHGLDDVGLHLLGDDVIDEPAVELAADEARHLVLGEDDVDEVGVFLVAHVGDDGVVEAVGEDFGLHIVAAGEEDRPHFHVGVDGQVAHIAPAGEHAGHLHHVLLGVVGVVTGPGDGAFADGEQLQQLAGVVLIGCRGGVLVAVQVAQHGGVDGDGLGQLAEVAPGVVAKQGDVAIDELGVVDAPGHVVVVPEGDQLFPNGGAFVQDDAHLPAAQALIAVPLEVGSRNVRRVDPGFTDGYVGVFLVEKVERGVGQGLVGEEFFERALQAQLHGFLDLFAGGTVGGSPQQVSGLLEVEGAGVGVEPGIHLRDDVELLMDGRHRGAMPLRGASAQQGGQGSSAIHAR